MTTYYVYLISSEILVNAYLYNDILIYEGSISL